jgi:hypothetical protein
MKPDTAYTNLQAELKTLIQSNQEPIRRSRLAKKLEKQFMAAWRLTPDRRGMSGRVLTAIQAYRTIDGSPIAGFDHCTNYTGADDQRVTVTQPYDISCSILKSGLALNNDACPEIIDASEWAFYYPGRAKLFIIKFPNGYAEALEKFRRASERAAVQAPWKSDFKPAKSVAGKTRKATTAR